MDLVPIEMAFFFYEIDSSQFHNSIGYANVMIYVKSLSTLSMALSRPWFSRQGFKVKKKACCLTSIEDIKPLPSPNLSIVGEHPKCGLKPLNQYQKEAVEEALVKSFTLVLGPPGKYAITSN